MCKHIDILLVTATTIETRAVLDAAYAITGQSPKAVERGNRTYQDFGEINGANVWLVQTEMGSSGPGGSLDTVGEALRVIVPYAVIMLGIAFGTKKSNQKIGDILVARQLKLYEPQRIGESTVIERGDKAHASTRLISRLSNAQLTWNKTNVYFGLMLSGEKLIDNKLFLGQLLQHEPEAIGGEMEGSGLYVACLSAKKDWILVKAICDWADGKKGYKKHDRQKLAARNAACFVWHALQCIPWTKGERGTWKLRIEGNIHDFDSARLNKICNIIKELSQDITVNITGAGEGSIVLLLEGSDDGFERIKELFLSGHLSIELDCHVVGIGFEEEWFDEPEDTKLRFLLNQGRSMLRAENYNVAEQSLSEALLLAQSLGEKSIAASSFCNLGLVYEKLGDFQRAITLHHAALDLDLELGHERGMANHYYNLGRTYKKLDNYEQSQSFLQLALELYKKLDMEEMTKSVEWWIATNEP
jgi:nucleoside phosphorylase